MSDRFPFVSLLGIALAAVLVADRAAPPALAQGAVPDTAFTYQGVLEFDGEPLDTSLDMVFRVYDVAVGGTPLAEQLLLGVPINEGLFTVELDFGVEGTGPGPRFLEVETAGPMSEVLSPRTPLRSAPKATQAAGASVEPDGGIVFQGAADETVTLTNDTAANGSAGIEFWQSFTAPATGRLIDFEFTGAADVSRQVFWAVFEGEGDFSNDLAMGVTTTLSSISANSINPDGDALPQQNVMLQEGQKYTLVLADVNDFSLISDSGGNSYAGGISNLGTRDLDFSVTVLVEGDAQASITPFGRFEGSGFKATASIPEIVLDSTAEGSGAFNFITMRSGFFDSSSLNDESWSLFTRPGQFNLEYFTSSGTFSDALTILGPSGNFGINEQEPVSQLQVTGFAVDGNLSSFIGGDDVVTVQDNDAVLGLYSTSAGTLGSAIKLSETTAPNADTWTIGRETQSGGDDLFFSWTLGGDYGAGERLFNFQNNGDMGIRVEIPEADLHIFNPDAPTIKLQSDGNSEESGRIQFRQANESGFDISYSGGSDFLLIRPLLNGGSQLSADVYIANSGSMVGHVGLGDASPEYRLELPNMEGPTGSGRARAWVTFSSQRYKEHVEPIADPIGKVERLRGVTFDWKAEYGAGADVGFIAEEVAAVFPEIVRLDSEGNAESFDYSRLVPVAIEAIKAQQATIDAQRAELQAQRARLESLERAVAELLESGG